MNTDISSHPDGRMSIRRTPSQIRMDKIAQGTMVSGRALVALLFIVAGVVKILGPRPFLNHMTEFGVPTFLLPAVIALELGGGVAIVIGWRVRDAAAALAVFCVLTATIFHHQLGISGERTAFFKDLAIAGGLFAMAANAAVLGRTVSRSG